jgi:hypothetical protein
MALEALSEWRDFYVMVGTAAAAILGATFIVVTLAAGVRERQLGLRGFISPTAVHLGSVVVGSAILAAPTLSRLILAILLGIGGLAGAGYSLIVARRIWRLNLQIEDRASYALIPILAYLTMGIAALMVNWDLTETLNILAVTIVVMLVVGIRNAWDMATFMITRDRSE